MPRLSRLVPILLACALALGMAQAQAAASPSPKPRTTTPTSARPVVKKPAKAVPGRRTKASRKEVVQAPPPLPPTPEQLPATRPTVTYRNGQLAILANNSTLQDVLSAVRQQTGANIESSGLAAGDRVYVKLGPGAPKDVLAALLDGSRFNFAILSSASDPNAIAHVVLMPKSGSGVPPSTVAANPAQPGMRTPPPQPQQPDEIQADEGQPDEEEPQPEEPQPQQGQQLPQEQPQEPQQQQPGQVRTPEQLLQELQQMQRQQQQQQPQGQNPDQQQQNPQPQPQPPDQQEQPPQEQPPD